MSIPSTGRKRRNSIRTASLLGLLVVCGEAAFAAGEPVIQSIQNRAGASTAVPGDVIDIIGSNLAPASAAADWPLPFTLATAQVFLNQFSAPILAVAPDRVRIQLPWELAGLRSAQIRVVRGGVNSEPKPVPLLEVSPAILGLDSLGITPGQTVTLRVIGLGPRSKNPITGFGPSTEAPGSAFLRLMVLIGDVPAPVTKDALATGGAQNDAGVQAVSVQVPFNVTAGAGVPLRIQMAGVESPSFPVTVEPGPVQISISPAVVEVPVGSSVAFQSSVQGADDQRLKWTLDANAYPLPNTPPAVGFVDNASFLATIMTVPNWALVRATHASGAFASALVQVVARDRNVYRILPDSPVIAAGETVSFTLIGPNGEPVDGATWRISDGFSSTNQNSYTAPQQFPEPQVGVWASVRGPNGTSFQAASTTIVIGPPRPQITGVSPSVAHVGEKITFQGTGLSSRVVYALFTGSGGARIRAGGGTDATITAPFGAISGPVWVGINAGNGGADFLSAPFPMTILPRLRLHPSRQIVSSTESIQISAVAPDNPIAWPLTWKADLGTVDSKGMFQAPVVTEPSFARVWACIAQTTDCYATVVQVLPFRFEPDPLIVKRGDTVRLKAWRGSAEVPAVWRAVSANLTVTPDGTLTVGRGPFDGGPSLVSATYGGITQNLSLTVQAAGAIAHTVEYNDWVSSPIQRRLDVISDAVAISGNWLYAASRATSYTGSYETLAAWLDVYRLDDSKNPVWMGSVEAPRDGITPTSLGIEGKTLFVTGQEPQFGTTANIVIRFDISNGYPVVQSRQTFGGNASAYRRQGMGFSMSPESTQDDFRVPITLQVQDYSNGAVRTLPLDYEPVFGRFSAKVNGSSGWAAVMFYYPFSDVKYETVVFDTTSERAVPIALLPSGGFNDGLTAMQDLLVVGPDVYRVSGNNVTFVSKLPTRNVLDFDPVTKRLLMEPAAFVQEDGIRVVDLSDPANPKISAPSVHTRQHTTGRLGPDYFVLLNGPLNAGIYPIEWSRGVTLVDRFPASPWMNDLRVRDGYLYWTGPGWGYKSRTTSLGLFEVNDVSGPTANVVAAMDRPGDQVGWAIELNGRYAYVGTDRELIVYDIGNPAAPVQGVVIPAPAISLALLGNYLYAGSNTGTNTLLLVYDVSDPARPRLNASIPLPEFAYGIAARPGWLAIALGKKGGSIYSLANPALPTYLAPLYGLFWDFAADRNLLYAAQGAQGFQIYDLSVPQNPVVLSHTYLGAGDEGGVYPEPMAVSIESRGVAWICTNKDGRVYGLDVRDPLHPRNVVEVTTTLGQYASAKAYVSNGRLFVAGNDGLFDVSTTQNIGIYQFAQPAPRQILPSRPTDFAPETALEIPVNESLKARYLRGDLDKDDHAEAGQQQRRPFKAERSGFQKTR